MGLMILAILIGASAASGSLLLGASLLQAFGIYVLTGAGAILVVALSIYLATRPATRQEDAQKENAPI